MKVHWKATFHKNFLQTLLRILLSDSYSLIDKIISFVESLRAQGGKRAHRNLENQAAYRDVLKYRGGGMPTG